MAIGLVYGVERMTSFLPEKGVDLTEEMLKHRQAVEISYKKVIERFRNVFPSLTCKEIQKKVTGEYWNMRNKKELAVFLQRENHDKCGEVTGKAARYAAGLILDEP
jgi:hypothetical protein